MSWVFQASLRNGLFKTTMPLNYHTDSKLPSTGRMTWSFVSMRTQQMSWIFPSVSEKQSCQDHLAAKTIILIWSWISPENVSKPHLLRERLGALSPSRMAQSCTFWKNGSKLCLPETWTMTVQKWCFPSLTDGQPFQDHLPPKTITSI